MKALNINIFNVDEFARTPLLENQKAIVEPKEMQKIIINTFNGDWYFFEESDRDQRTYCLQMATNIIASTHNPEASAELVITEAEKIYKYLYGGK